MTRVFDLVASDIAIRHALDDGDRSRTVQINCGKTNTIVVDYVLPRKMGHVNVAHVGLYSENSSRGGNKLQIWSVYNG